MPTPTNKECGVCLGHGNAPCGHAPTQPESSWEKRLKELGHQEDEGFYIPDIDDLKDFIRAEIEAARKEEQYIARNEIEEATENGYLKGRQDVLTELEEKLPKALHETVGYYRTAVLALIQQLKAK